MRRRHEQNIPIVEKGEEEKELQSFCEKEAVRSEDYNGQEEA